jgi:hypothetical protein
MRKLAIVLGLAFVVLTAAGSFTPAESLPCIAFGVCRPCTLTTAQPCLVVRCGTEPPTHLCGLCTANCVPPGI